MVVSPESPGPFFGRQRELAQIDRFLDDPGPGFTHLRGRRRIGKTELLRRVQRARPNCYYFMGRGDEHARQTLKRFAREWDAFTSQPRLTRLKLAELSWDEAFREVGRHIAAATDAPLIMIFDEIQWVSGRGVGFCGLLKEYWGEWKKLGRVKVVISGSSNRFFQRYTDGEMAVLRGLRTHATIWLRPFSLSEVRRFYFPAWTQQECCLIYMMLGGVPYYLESIVPDDNFIRAVNNSMFCGGGIFLEEVDAMLKLDAATVGSRRRVKELLASLGQDGATEAVITRATGFTQDYVHKTLDRLLDYGLVHERWPLGVKKTNRAGVRYFMDDFYLNTYYQVLRPLESRIRANERGMIFPAEVVQSKSGYFIPDFSGKAFELLLAHVIKEGCDDEAARTQPLFDKLELQTGRYEWGTYWKSGSSQIDLVVAGLDDREYRVIEAKWVGRSVDASSDVAEQLLGKQFEAADRKGWRRSDYLALSNGFSRALLDRVSRQGMSIIELSDLFE